jgi:hypothetical protein
LDGAAEGVVGERVRGGWRGLEEAFRETELDASTLPGELFDFIL